MQFQTKQNQLPRCPALPYRALQLDLPIGERQHRYIHDQQVAISLQWAISHAHEPCLQSPTKASPEQAIVMLPPRHPQAAGNALSRRLEAATAGPKKESSKGWLAGARLKGAQGGLEAICRRWCACFPRAHGVWGLERGTERQLHCGGLLATAAMHSGRWSAPTSQVQSCVSRQCAVCAVAAGMADLQAQLPALPLGRGAEGENDGEEEEAEAREQAAEASRGGQAREGLKLRAAGGRAWGELIIMPGSPPALTLAVRAALQGGRERGR